MCLYPEDRVCIQFVLKILSAFNVCYIYILICPECFTLEANTTDSDQMAPNLQYSLPKCTYADERAEDICCEWQEKD